MKDRVHQTIIIGAGIAGLACARKLHENGKEFLVISKNIGGRCGKYSKDGVSYGAYFIMDNFHYFKKFVRIKRRIEPTRILFHNGCQGYRLLDKGLLSHPVQVMRSLYLIFKFKKHYETFKKKCETISQAQALKSDPFLWALYNKKASVFFKEHNIKEFQEDYICPVLYLISFPPPHKTNAFVYLQWLLTVITPFYEFIFMEEKMVKGFRRDIILDTVNQIKKGKELYTVKTKKKIFRAKNVVVAAPYPFPEILLHIKKPANSVKSYFFHISGRLRESYDQVGLNAFKMGNIYAIAPQTDGTFIFYSKEKNPKFSDYFYEYKVIWHKFWKPAFIFREIPLESEQDRNLYLIGDYNFPGLEDAYITGIYAANRIIGSR